MLRKVTESTRSADTDLLSGYDDRHVNGPQGAPTWRSRNASTPVRKDLKKATCNQVLMGITKASLATESFPVSGILPGDDEGPYGGGYQGQG